jgi:hypothetical protein
MNIKRQLLNIIALVALVTLVTSAPQFSFSRFAHAQRSSSKLIVSRTADGPDTDTFTPKDHVIYCVLATPNADPKAKYKFIWGRYTPAASTPETLFQEEVTSQNGRAVSKFYSSSDLPAGEYSVNLWADRPSHARKVFAVK